MVLRKTIQGTIFIAITTADIDNKYSIYSWKICSCYFNCAYSNEFSLCCSVRTTAVRPTQP